MSMAKQDTPFRAPVPRPQPQLWYAVYELPRKAFLDAVEEAASRMPSPRKGLHWEYEGFNRRSLFLLPVADSDDSSDYFESVVFGFDVGGGKVHVYVESAEEGKIYCFKQLLAALDSLEHVSQACITSCSLLDDDRA